jgi:endo-alpha-1,4-polygalactosaminidase (GH114 family)
MDLDQIQIKSQNRQRENSQVVNKIVSFLKNNHKEEVIIYKNWGSGLGRSGRPDLEIMFNGNTWYIEAKDPNGKLSNVQKSLIEKAKNVGITVYVISSFEQFMTEMWPIMKK